MALKSAKEKAEKMATVLGQSLGDPIQINENNSSSPRGYSSIQAMTQNVVQNIQSEGSELSETIALGKISIRANVTVIFELNK